MYLQEINFSIPGITQKLVLDHYKFLFDFFKNIISNTIVFVSLLIKCTWV